MKKLLAILLSTLILVSLAACGNSLQNNPAKEDDTSPKNEQETIELVCAHAFPANGNEHTTMLKAAEMLSEKTGGKLTMQVYSDGSLGSEMEVCAQILAGAIDLGFSEGSAWADATGVSELNVFGLPYLYNSNAALKDAGLNIVPNACNEIFEKNNVNLVAFQPLSGGLRGVLTTKKPIRTPDDFSGMKLRCPEIKLFSDTISALGANPTPIAFTEVYTAMSQNVVDGMELDAVTTRDNNLHEVIKYFTNTYHLGSLNIMCMNKKKWDSIPTEYQEIYKEVMLECISEQYDMREVAVQEALNDIAAAGVEIIDLSPDDMTVLASKMEPVWKKYRDMGLSEIIDQLASSGK